MIHVTAHALLRYRERVTDCTEAEARAAVVAIVERAHALEFGAHYVRLGTGQHIVIRDGSVITVLPKDAPLWRLAYFAREVA